MEHLECQENRDLQVQMEQVVAMVLMVQVV